MKNIENLKKYLLDNPIKSIFFMMNILGGLLFLFYFIHIDFMPTLHIQDMVHLLFAMALMGLVMTLFLVILFIMPALAWKHIFEKPLSDILEMSIKNINENTSNKEKKIIRNLFSFNLFVGVVLILWLMLFEKDWALFWCLVAITILAAMLIQYMYYLKDIDVKKNDHFVIIGSSLVVYAMIIFPIFVLLITLKHADEIVVMSSGLGGWIITISGLILIVIVNLILYDTSNPNILEDKSTTLGNWKYLVPVGAIVFLAFFMARDIGFISRDVMRMLHMGNFNASKIVIKSDICLYLSKDYPSKNITYETNSTCRMSDVFVYSRIGQEMLIRMSTDKNITNKVIVLKKDILSFSWENKIKKTK